MAEQKSNPLAMLLESDMTDTSSIPAKLQAVEDSIDEFCGKQTGIQAVALIPGHGEVKSKESFRECDDFKAAMAEIHAAK